MASQAQYGVDRSATALGLGYKQWTRKHMAVILSHYGVRFATGDTNNMLINSLNQLAAQRGLTREDRLAIIKAHKAGLNLPPCKPHIGSPIVVPTITQTAGTLSGNAQHEDYSSGTSDGRNVEMPDEELMEELPSLSEEERDLREYTATMNWPRSSGQRRALGARFAATRGTIHSMPVKRPVLLNRSPPQISVLSKAHRSRPAAANRAGRPLTSQRWRDLAHSRIADPVSSTQATSGPPTLKTSQVINPECTICYNSFDPVKILMRQPTSSCVHEVNICKPCLSASISSQMKTELWTRISCPASTCKEFLGYDDIQEFAEPQDFAR